MFNCFLKNYRYQKNLTPTFFKKRKILLLKLAEYRNAPFNVFAQK